MSEFNILNNGINSNFKIIEHDSTGYYNITKMNNQVYDKICKQNELGGIPPNSKKQIKEWFSNKSNKELIIVLQKLLDTTDELYYNLKDDIEFEYHGTYVHKLLFDTILAWIDKPCAIEIAVILNQKHINTNKEKMIKLMN